MLKITSHDNGKRTVLELDGKLVGPWVDELERVWYLAERAGSVHVVAPIYRSGAEVFAVGCLAEALLQDVIKKESAAWMGPAKEAVRDRSESVASWTRDPSYRRVVLAARR